MSESLMESAAGDIRLMRANREIDGLRILKLFVGATVHEQHDGGPTNAWVPSAWDVGLIGEANGGLVWHPWVAIVAEKGMKPAFARFPMSTGHDMRGIGRILADKDNFFAFEHHMGNILFTITGDEFFVPLGTSDFR